MRKSSRIIAASVVALAGAFATAPAFAQNTYADVPFNQGSVFYRPSGARPPRTSARPVARPNVVAPAALDPVGHWSAVPYAEPRFRPARRGLFVRRRR